MVPFVEPAYGRRGLGDVVPAVGRALGTDVLPAPSDLVLPEAPAYVVFLVDGLGSRLLERYADAAPYLSSLVGDSEPGTVGVPSTTATSLTSLGTALAPGAHGLVGFTSRVPGTDRLLNALFWDKTVDPIAWQPHPTAFSRLTDAGVRVDVVNKREFDRSGLTIAAHRGAGYIGADRVGERIAAAVAGSLHRPSLTYLYDGDLDWTGHRYGVDSPQWRLQLASIDAEAQQLREALPAEVRLVVVADHGMVDSPPWPAHRHRRARGTARRPGAAGWGGALPAPLLRGRRGRRGGRPLVGALGGPRRGALPRGGDRAWLVRRGRGTGAAPARRRAGRRP
jgi:hypothetical protein